MRRAALALLFLLLVTPATEAKWSWTKQEKRQLEALLAKVEKGEAFPHRLEAEHWIVETAVTPRFTAELGLFMDTFSEAFEVLMKDLDAQPKTQRKPTVQVYASHEEYAKEHTDGSRGYYRYKWDGQGQWTELHLYTFIEHPYEREFARFYHPILQHEGTHVLLRRLLGQASNAKWLDEGIATWFQFYDLRSSVKANRKRRYGRSTFRLQHLPRALGSSPTLQQLLDLGPLTFNPDSMGPKGLGNYGLAESFVDFLLSSPRGAEVFKAAFHRLRSGELPLIEPALVKGLEPRWLEHARKAAKR